MNENQMNEKQKRIKTSSKVIAIIMKIGYIAMIVAMSICIVSLTFIGATGGKTSIVTSGGMKIMAVGAPLPLEGIVAICIAAIIISAFFFVIFLLTYRIFKEISITCMPFNEKYVKTIKTVGILIVVMSIVGSIANTMASTFTGMDTLGLYSNSPGIVFGIIVFCLAYIFDYGCTLLKQTEDAH